MLLGASNPMCLRGGMARARRKPGRRSESVASETRQRLVETARALFAERGFEAVSLRTIAERSGLSHGLLRHHFGSKEELWLAVVLQIDAEFVDALASLERVDRPEADARSLGRAFVVALTEVQARTPDAVRLVLHESFTGGERLDTMLQVLEPARQRVARLVRRLHDAGLIREHTPESFFGFLLMSTGSPWALPALTRGLTGRLPTAAEHSAVVAKTLFG